MPSESASWPMILAAFAVGFWLLKKGADWLVGGSAQIARAKGVSPLVTGLTIIAFGTSAPEIVVSALAAAEGDVDLSLGNVLGSNVANIGLVLGACAVVLPRVLESKLTKRDQLWMFGSLFLLWAILWDGTISRLEGGVLFGAFVAYNVHVLSTGREEVAAPEDTGTYRRPSLWVLLGIVGVAVGAKFVVTGAQWGAERIGIPESVIGLTVVAVGTSLPELAAGLGGALKGEADISIGNVVGSNVFNLLAVIGIVALIQPFDAGDGGLSDPERLRAAFDLALNEDLWVVLAFSVACVLLTRSRGAGRTKGVLLLTAYTAYTVWLYVSR